MQKLMKWRDGDVIKVITGIRRSGKSTLMLMAKEAILQSGIAPENIAYINFEERKNSFLDSPEKVWHELDSQLIGDGKKYVFLDEVQRVTDFEKLVDGLYADKQYDVYITGSNAWMLSGELASYLSGRYVEIHVTPFSFAEFTADASIHRLDAFLDYEKYGSFPFVRYLLEAGRKEDVGQYLDGVLNTVLLKDVAMRMKMSDTAALRRIAEYLFDNIANLTSIKRISDALTETGGKVSYHSVETYIQSLCDAYVFYKCERVNVKGLEIFKSGTKYYAVDPGLRYYLNGNRGGDSGRILENIVFLELKRRFGNVFTAQTRSGKEIDFVTRNNGEIRYFQVAESVRDEKVLIRELAALKEVRDNYPKFLITKDFENRINHDGIEQLNVFDFLLDI